MSQRTASGSGGIADAGGMSMTIGEGVLGPPTTVPKEDESDASLTDDVNVGAVPNIVSALTNMLRNKRKRKQEKEVAPTNQDADDGTDPDATINTSQVPGPKGVSSDNGAAEKAKKAKEAEDARKAKEAKDAQLAAAIKSAGPLGSRVSKEDAKGQTRRVTSTKVK